MKTDLANTLERAEVELEILRKNGRARANQDKIDLMVYNLLASSDYRLSDEDFRQAIAAYTRIANGNPLTELTCGPTEWEDIDEALAGSYVWNKRAPTRVYRDPKGGIFCRYGRVFKKPDGTVIPSSFCDIEIREFPFRVPGRPKTVILYGNETPEQWYKRHLDQGKITG